MQGSVVPAHSQEYKVKEALNRAGVSHNSGVLANLSNVQMGLNGVVYFCTSRLTVGDEKTAGDGGALPDRIKLVGDWDFPKPGYYDMRNVRVVANGAISIIREPESELVCTREFDTDWEFAMRRP